MYVNDTGNFVLFLLFSCIVPVCVLHYFYILVIWFVLSCSPQSNMFVLIVLQMYATDL
jgi:hypothetical protein